jgi:hypothetical protein
MLYLPGEKIKAVLITFLLLNGWTGCSTLNSARHHVDADSNNKMITADYKSVYFTADSSSLFVNDSLLQRTTALQISRSVSTITTFNDSSQTQLHQIKPIPRQTLPDGDPDKKPKNLIVNLILTIWLALERH